MEVPVLCIINDILMPAILFDHVSYFNYEFSFFVLLTGFKCMFLYMIMIDDYDVYI